MQQGQSGPVAAPEPEPELVREVPPPIFDPNGDLLESDQLFAWVTLPRGLEPVLELEGRTVYRTEVPIYKVQRYFGPRLLTGAVERRGDGIVYLGALPRSIPTGSRPRRLDVSITSASDGVRVELVARPPRREVADPVAQRRLIEEHLQRLD